MTKLVLIAVPLGLRPKAAFGDGWFTPAVLVFPIRGLRSLGRMVTAGYVETLNMRIWSNPEPVRILIANPSAAPLILWRESNTDANLNKSLLRNFKAFLTRKCGLESLVLKSSAGVP